MMLALCCISFRIGDLFRGDTRSVSQRVMCPKAIAITVTVPGKTLVAYRYGLCATNCSFNPSGKCVGQEHPRTSSGGKSVKCLLPPEEGRETNGPEEVLLE